LNFDTDTPITPVPPMPTTLIGIDCATQPNRTGLALGVYESGSVRLERVTLCQKRDTLIDLVSGWITSAGTALLALDAPLGWPADLGRELAAHRAGQHLATCPDWLFRRQTDRFIRSKTGKQSLDVGADRIARTAHAALSLLSDLRDRTSQPIPLAWDPSLPPGASSIEVYPAVTLPAHGVNTKGYKGPDGKAIRRQLLTPLADHLDLSQVESARQAQLAANDDLFDAVICVLAAADFIRGEAYPPEDKATALLEGWIWVKKSADH
jgi:hypothetical protein